MARNMSLYGTPFRPAATDTFSAKREALSAAAGTDADVDPIPSPACYLISPACAPPNSQS